MNLNSTKRFSDRVEDYVRYRPTYPAELLEWLTRERPFKCVADVGSGTGILTKLLLERRAEVFAVEPNREMREAAEEVLHSYPGFRSCDGTAEQTGLAAHSVDLVTCAQSFHWFDPLKTREEFRRILKPGAAIALIWNEQVQDDFGRAYEDVKRKFGGRHYQQVSEVTDNLDAVIDRFFDPGYQKLVFENHQDLDKPGLVGRYFSSSYSPPAGSPLRAEAAEALVQIFERFQRRGLVRLLYETRVFVSPKL